MFKKPLNFPGLILLVVWLSQPCGGAKPPLYVRLTTGQHQLLLDDYLIGALYHVERRINQPVKYEGNPVIFADKPWEQGPGPYWNPATQKVLQIRSAPCWDPDEKVWKLWYFPRTRQHMHAPGMDWSGRSPSWASGNTRAPKRTIS